jgi:hypothetical protein
MGGRKVLAPDGRGWKVGRDWIPPRVRLRRERNREGSEGWDLLEFADLDLGPFAFAIAIVFVVLFVVIVWPLLALAIELVILIVVFIATLAGRLLQRRPWRIVARSREPWQTELDWHVTGWRSSRRAIDAVASALEAGVEPRLPADVEPSLPPPGPRA